MSDEGGRHGRANSTPLLLHLIFPLQKLALQVQPENVKAFVLDF